MAKRIPPDAFAEYLQMGPQRSYAGLAARLGVSKRAVARKAVRENWQERLEEVESRVREGAEGKAVESLEQMADRHHRILRVLQGRALDALRSSAITPGIAVRALLGALREERELRSLPTRDNVEDSAREHARRIRELTAAAIAQFDIVTDEEPDAAGVG